MTHENIRKWLELSKQASDGPWLFREYDSGLELVSQLGKRIIQIYESHGGGSCPDKSDSDFITESRNITCDVEKLLRECEEMRAFLATVWFLATVCKTNYEAFLYENRDSTNVPGSKDQPRNAYNATKALADRSDYLLKKWKAE